MGPDKAAHLQEVRQKDGDRGQAHAGAGRAQVEGGSKGSELCRHALAQPEGRGRVGGGARGQAQDDGEGGARDEEGLRVGQGQGDRTQGEGVVEEGPPAPQSRRAGRFSHCTDLCTASKG
jgi:hypothetical protein